MGIIHVPFMLVVVGFFFAGFVVVGFLRSPLRLEAWRVRRQHRRAATRPLAELPEGELGRMVGRVAEFEGTLVAPLSGRRCVYYALVVEDPWDKRGRKRLTERQGVAFAIADDSGKAIIDPKGARIALNFDQVKYVGGRGETTPEQSALLARFGLGQERLDWMTTLMFREAVIVIGETVAVVGAGVREPDAEPRATSDYRTLPTKLWVTNAVEAPLSIVGYRSQ